MQETPVLFPSSSYYTHVGSVRKNRLEVSVWFTVRVSTVHSSFISTGFQTNNKLSAIIEI